MQNSHVMVVSTVHVYTETRFGKVTHSCYYKVNKRGKNTGST